MIELKHIYKSFDNNDIFSDFNYSFENKKYLIIGKSGSGKTTLINLILGLCKPDKGQILTNCTFSCSFQQPRLLEEYSAKKNIEIFTKKTFNNFQLLSNDIVNQKVKTLSGGQKQKLSIFIACKANSNCIILDEPFNNLDSDSIKEAVDFINKDVENKTLIICSHQTEYLENFQIIDLDHSK